MPATGPEAIGKELWDCTNAQPLEKRGIGGAHDSIPKTRLQTCATGCAIRAGPSPPNVQHAPAQLIEGKATQNRTDAKRVTRRQNRVVTFRQRACQASARAYS